MANPIKYDILMFLAARLPLIQEPDYTFTVTDNIFLKVPNQASWGADAVYPAIYLWPDEMQSSEEVAVDFSSRDLIVNVVAVNNVTENFLKEGCQMESDLERVLIPSGGAFDVRTGVLAQVTVLSSNIFVSDQREWFAGCFMSFRVRYLTSRTDPRTV